MNKRRRKKVLICKVQIVMDGFASKEEIKDEINFLIAKEHKLSYVSKIIFANIDHWAKWCYCEGNDVVWERMSKLGIVIEPQYCSH